MRKYVQVTKKKKLLTDDDFIRWCLVETKRENAKRRPATVTKFLRLLFQVCHIVFGLKPYDLEKPKSHEDELVCVTEWQHRDSHR